MAGLSRGIFFNAGAAVILPVVFAQALTLARNLGHRVTGFSTVDLDFVRQHRPERPMGWVGRHAGCSGGSRWWGIRG